MSVELIRDVHKVLAYLIFLAALANLVLALTKGRTDARMARILRWGHRAGVLGAGRLAVVVGLGLFHALPYSLGTWWIWGSLLLWGPVEVLGKRLVRGEVDAVVDGGQASGRLVLGVGLQLVCVVIIFGLMSVRPG